MNSVQVRSLFIPPNLRQSPFYNVYNTYAPKRITFGLLAAENFNGSYSKAFCNFQVYLIVEKSQFIIFSHII